MIHNKPLNRKIIIITLLILFLITLSTSKIMPYFSHWNRVQAQTNSAEWNTLILDNVSPCGFYPSLAFDSLGKPAVSYLSERDGGRLKFATIKDNVWELQLLPDDGYYYGSYSSLAFKPDGNPAISYYNYSSKSIKYASFDGNSWNIEKVARANLEGDISLAFDGLGYPVIAHIYCNYPWSTKTSIVLSRWNGSTWVSETVDNTGYEAWHLSLSFDPFGNPAISYYDATKKNLKFAILNDNSWEIEVVDSTYRVGEFNSLAFDQEGNPGISYYDKNNDMVKYAYKRNNSWNIEFIDIGMYSSLAFDNIGNPAIAFGSDDSLKYAYLAGTSWVIERVTDNSIKRVSLAFSSEGKPSIAYTNWSYAGSTLGYSTLIKGYDPPQPALPKFLTLPFYENDLDQWGNGIRVGWVYASNHRGIDFYKSPFEDGQYGSGTVFDIIAAAPGEAYWNENFPNASDGKLGYYVVIKHDEKDDNDKHYYTLYAHLEDNSINSRIPKQGNGTVRVDRGEYLGKAGDSGAIGMGVHLHFEVHRGFQETKLDPYDLRSGRDAHYREIANTIICGDNRLWINSPPSHSQAVPQPDPVPKATLGDLTGNGKIDVKDATLVMQHVLGLKALTDNQKKAADVNGDGKIDIRDVVLIVQKILGLINKFPAE